MQADGVSFPLLFAAIVGAVFACGDRAAPDIRAARNAASASALRAFVRDHPGAREAVEARARLARLGPPLSGFDAVFPSEVQYVCHRQAGDPRTPIPDDIIAYVALPGAAIEWSELALIFAYDAPFVLRPAVDASGPVGMAKNTAGRSVRSGKRCINEVQFEGDTVNVPGGLQFAPGGTLAGPRR